MLQRIQNGLNAYAEVLPRDIPKSAALSGVFSFAVTCLLTGDIKKAVNTGVVAATLSVICGLVIGIFRKTIIDPNAQLTWFQDVAIKTVSAAVVQVLCNKFSVNINVINYLFIWVILDAVLLGMQDKNPQKCPEFVFLG